HSDDMALLQAQMSLDRSTATAQNAFNMIKFQTYASSLASKEQAWLDKNPGKTKEDIPPGERATMQAEAAGLAGITTPRAAPTTERANEAALDKVIAEDKAQWQKDHPGETMTAAVEFQIRNKRLQEAKLDPDSTLTPEAVKLAAERIRNGDINVISNLGRG